jgi:hypothetical protein
LFDQHVDAAKARYSGIHNRSSSAWVADVSIDQRKIRARGKWICFCNVARVRNDVVTPLQECFDESRSDPLGAPVTITIFV